MKNSHIVGILCVAIFLIVYGVLIHWRPYAQSGLFSYQWLNEYSILGD